MPERLEIVLGCDRDGCMKRGKRYYVESGSLRTEIILCDRHASFLTDITEVGRPEHKRRKRKRRDSGEARILSLIDIDLIDTGEGLS